MALQNNITLIINNGVKTINKIIELNNINNTKILFSFDEHHNVAIRCNTKAKVTLYKTSLLSSDNDLDEFITLRNNETYKLTSKDNYIYLPGTYDIFINDDIYNFEVTTSKGKNYFDLLYVREYLRNIYENYIYNINSYQNNIKLNNTKAFSYLNILDNHFDFINKLAITNKTYNKETIETIIIKENILKKQNSKTIRKNILSQAKSLFFNVKKVLKTETNNTYYGNITNQILLLLKTQLDNIKNHINKEKKEIDILNNKNKFGYQYSSDINHINNKLNMINKLENQYNNLDKYYYLFNNICHTLKIKDTLDFNHERLTNIYNLLTKDANYTFTATPKLYEYYLFYILENLILELGFEKENNNYLEEASSYNYYKDNKKIELMYDYSITNDYKCFNTFINLSSRHNRPDFIISLYENNDLKYSYILDAKYRLLEPLIKDNSLVKTAIDYYQLAYSNYLDIIKPIKSVIYLGLGEDLVEEDRFIKYLGFVINKDIYKTNAYLKLKEYLKKFE